MLELSSKLCSEREENLSAVVYNFIKRTAEPLKSIKQNLNNMICYLNTFGGDFNAESRDGYCLF